jgi:hypothetical protein
MKILFTILVIDTNIPGQGFYLDSAKRLSTEILSQTTHDLYITTNNVSFFDTIKSNRLTIRNNININNILFYNTEFNFNLKHYAFLDINSIYDYIIYLDCDIKLDRWKENSDKFMNDMMSHYEFGADRTNCTLSSQVEEFQNTGNALFKHKIQSYDILKRFALSEDIYHSVLPSEHFLILKNIPEKIQKFQQKWSELDLYLQNKNGEGGAWGDGFEIGISARYAGLHNILTLNPFYWKETLGFQFNGNKF